jgi:hypothetical protein
MPSVSIYLSAKSFAGLEPLKKKIALTNPRVSNSSIVEDSYREWVEREHPEIFKEFMGE